MWSDEFDKKISDAAGNDTPPYDEKSWERMELLLNKHLPQEKKRRRFILFFLLFLLLGGASAIILLNTTGKNKTSSVAEQSTKTGDATESTSSRNSPAAALPNNKKEQSQANDKSPLPVLKDNSTSNAKNSPKGTGLTNNEEPKLSGKNTNNKNKVIVSPRITSTPISTTGGETKEKKKTNLSSQKEILITANNPKDKKEEDKKKVPENANSLPDPVSDVTTTNSASNDNNRKSGQENNQLISAPVTVATDSANLASNPATTEDAKKETADSSAIALDTDFPEPVKTEKKKDKKGNQLILSLSGGPDISAVGTKPGKWQMQYGVGIGYAISRRFTIRTGFYVARKIYSADSNSYKTPLNVVNYYYNLEKVNGNCLVYEIPLTAVYNITTTKKHSWFVSTGLSSFLMKTEDYECTYKNPAGQTQMHYYSYDNKNSHFFSVINLSGGYQYNFTDRLSAMAEPYIKMPLAGVGAGKVKLNSAGVLFTIGYKPFIKPKVSRVKK